MALGVSTFGRYGLGGGVSAVSNPAPTSPYSATSYGPSSASPSPVRPPVARPPVNRGQIRQPTGFNRGLGLGRPDRPNTTLQNSVARQPFARQHPQGFPALPPLAGGQGAQVPAQGIQTQGAQAQAPTQGAAPPRFIPLGAFPPPQQLGPMALPTNNILSLQSLGIPPPSRLLSRV